VFQVVKLNKKGIQVFQVVKLSKKRIQVFQVVKLKGEGNGFLGFSSMYVRQKNNSPLRCERRDRENVYSI
jgi:hypothetical protein